MVVSQAEVSAWIALSIYRKVSVVRGHHMYKKSWTPDIRELLPMERDEDNQQDDYAVAVVKNKEIGGHVPRSISLHIDNLALIRDPAFIIELMKFTPCL